MRAQLIKATGLALLGLMLACGAATAQSGDLTAEEIVEKADYVSYYQGEDGRAQVTMTISGSQGDKRNREFVILRKDLEEESEGRITDQRYYVYFHRPADVRKMVFMVWKHTAEEETDDRWLYLPSMDLVKRIAAGDKRTSFVGSNFFYEDVSGRNMNLDQHELAQTTDTYYVIESTPKKPEQVEFSYYRTWIHKDTFLPVQAVYWDKNRDKYREYKVLEVDTIQGYTTVTKSRMKNLRDGSQTVIDYENVTYDVGIPKDIFSERYLRQPPTQYLR
ncbi:MAG: outer membrane lipoprotein-sorting protein [Desulfohalobiaceae bacterium]